jgi:stress response protein YsnF
MLRNSNQLKGMAIHATDGELGTVDELYFDDESWGIRYLTVETGGWLGGKDVLISPYSVNSTDWEGRRVNVSLTKKQIENSPSIDTHKPISRQHEASYLGYYEYPYYWGGPYLWGSGYCPGSPVGNFATQQKRTDALFGPSDFHLRSAEEVKKYHIEATDGEIGSVNGFVIDDEAWAIRYIEAVTRNWLPGKDVLFSPAWIKRVSWADSKVYVELTREAIKNCPEYSESKEITRDYENAIYRHYGRPPYWLHEEATQSLSSVSGG